LGGVPTKIETLVGPAANIKSTLGCNNRDYALVMYANSCGITKVTSVSPSSSSVAGQVTLQDATAAISQGSISCLGPQWHEVTYRVNAGTLERRDTANGPAFMPSVADVVNIQAQYGISALPASNQVTQWVDPTGMWADGAISVDNRKLIKAVRFAVVARNAKMDQGFVSSTCTTALGVVNNGPCAWDDANFNPAPRIDLSVDYPQWRQFNYRVFETIIPLRNVVWAATTLP
jgi:type IV pilus assembly protein PilW